MLIKGSSFLEFSVPKLEEQGSNVAWGSRDLVFQMKPEFMKLHSKRPIYSITFIFSDLDHILESSFALK